jgi:hypothetical protein
VEKKLLQEIRDEEPVYSEFVLLISLWCRVLIFPKYHMWKKVVSAKLSTIVLFLVEKSPAKINCLLACMSARWQTGKKRTTGLFKRGVSWGGGVKVRKRGGHLKLCQENIFRQSRNSTSARKTCASLLTSVTCDSGRGKSTQNPALASKMYAPKRVFYTLIVYKA